MSKKQELPITKTTIVEESPDAKPTDQVKELASRAQGKPVIEYVVGFLFGPTRDQPDQVALIKKIKPKWQEGLLNGVGGHVEPGEDPAKAMRREFFEEAGADIDDWEYFGTICYGNTPNVDHPNETMAKVHYFRSFKQTTLITKTAEKVDWHILQGFKLHNTPHVKSLDFLIPLALESHAINYQIRGNNV